MQVDVGGIPVKTYRILMDPGLPWRGSFSWVRNRHFSGVLVNSSDKWALKT
jgi:hypothetical protein